MVATLRTRIVTDLAGWEAIEADWESVRSRTRDANAFQSHAFLSTWWEHFGTDKQLDLILVYRDDDLVGIAPLQRTTKRLLLHKYDVLEFLGMPDELARPKFLVADGDEQILQAILETLTDADFDILQLDELEAGWQSDALCRWAESDQLWCREEPLHVVPYLERAADWEDYYAGLSGHFKKRLKSAKRKAEKRYKVDYRVAETREDLEAVLGRFFEIEQRSWKSDAGVAVGDVPGYRGFYRDLLCDTSREICGHGITQSFDGEPSAVTIGFSHRETYYSLQIAHDQNFAGYSPGTLLEAFEMEWFFGRGFHRYEFLGGAGFNKRRWTETAVATQTLLVRRPGLHMALSDFAEHRAKPAILRVLGRNKDRPETPLTFTLRAPK